MTRLLAFVLFALAPPTGAGARTFVCKATSFTQLNDAGQLVENNYTKTMLKAHPEFLFNEADGMLRWPPHRWQFKIVQQGNDQNSLIAVRFYEGLASTVVQTLRIRTWTATMPFVYDDGGDIYSGTCRKF